MANTGPVPIPFPLSSFPGANSQESAGRLINCYAEPLGEGGPAKFKWIRSAGLSQHAATANSGYRGGLAVNNAAIECWANNASSIDVNGNVTSIGNFPGTGKVSIARNQASPVPDVVAVDIGNGAYVLESATVAPATVALTFSGSTVNIGDVITLAILNASLSPPFPVSILHTVVASESPTTLATAFKTAINANSTLSAANVSATSSGAVLTINHQGAVGNQTSILAAITPIGSAAAPTTISASVTGAGNETVAFTPTGGVLASSGGSLTATSIAAINGTTFTAGDAVSLTFTNANVSTFPITISHTLGAAETATIIATALKTAINASTALAAVGITSTAAGGVVTINQTLGTEAVTPSSASLTGGAGTYGAFSGIPTSYNGQGVLPQPNSVCFQDGYFFFTINAGQIYATTLNGLAMNALTYVTVQAKSDVSLLRGIAFSGFLLAFTTGSCEVWQDAASPAPNFPYGRIGVLEFGLVQASAIAGWETGFSELIWVAQDFGVHWMTPGQLGQAKISPPDLDRLIETQVRLGNVIEAGCYIASGKKFWTLSSPAWTWEFNLETKKWNERWSLASGVFGRWRATGGHPAFNKWLMGDQLTGNILFADDTNFTDNGAVQLFRIESGPVVKFPEQVRIARADFNFVFGVGQTVGTSQTTVTGAVSGNGGVVRLSVISTAQMTTGDVGAVSGVLGTTEANGTWTLTVIDATDVELQGTVFANAYVSGGTITDLTAAPNVQNPTVAISTSKDGGLNWGNPLVRSLNQQSAALRGRAMVANMGLSGAMGNRWRLDVSDPVYCSFLGGTQSSELRMVGS